MGQRSSCSSLSVLELVIVSGEVVQVFTMQKASISRVALAGVLLGSAVMHVVRPQTFYPVVPRALCKDLPAGRSNPVALLSRKSWVVMTAVPEAAGAVGLLVPSTRKTAATAVALMFAGFSYAHISQLRHAYGPKRSQAEKRFATARLPLQIPLVAWAWSARKS